MQPLIREAVEADDAIALRELTVATWSSSHTPAPLPTGPFVLGDDHVLLAELDGEVTGYVSVGRPFAIPSGAHVRMISGLVVAPAHRGRGLATALVHAAIDHARDDGAAKLSLRVLGHNEAAQRLYAGLGFVVEGRLRDEFILDAVAVDDLFMALDLTRS